MRRRIRITLAILALAGLMLASGAMAASQFVYFTSGTASTTQANIPLPGYADWVLITNDGATRIYILFGAGTVNTTTGAGGGYLEPTETYTFQVRANHVGIKTAAATSTYRVWSGHQ